MSLRDDGLETTPTSAALARIQQKLRAFAPENGLVSDELIAERKAEEAAEHRPVSEMNQTKDG